MIGFSALAAFALVALGIACSPGPNMIYLLSRSIAQGRMAGVMSLGGVTLAFVIYMLAAACGLTALFLAVPFAYAAVKIAGASYLLWLAWNAIKPGARSALTPRALPADPPRRLFTMGFLTSLLNPKIAILYVSLLPQFENPARLPPGAGPDPGPGADRRERHGQPPHRPRGGHDRGLVRHAADLAARAAMVHGHRPGRACGAAHVRQRDVGPCPTVSTRRSGAPQEPRLAVGRRVTRLWTKEGTHDTGE